MRSRTKQHSSYQVLVFVAGVDDLELGAPVDLVGGFLVFLAQGFYELLVERHTFFKLRILAMDALGDGLGTLLALAGRFEALLGDAILDKVVHNTLGATL